MTENTNGYVSGWVPNLSIGSLVETYPTVFSAAAFILISMLDSNENIAEIMNRLPAAREVTPVSDMPFVITGADLERLMANYRLFTGFDELWVCERPPVDVPPDDASLVAPEQVSQQPPAATVAWMEKATCVLALGDGIGLNYVARDPVLLEQLGLGSLRGPT